MSVADKLTKLNTDLTASYDAVEEQGGTLPTQKNTENLAPAILSIPKGGGGSGLKSIHIETVGKTSYLGGETFSLDGYVIIATFDNEAQKEVTSSCTFTPTGKLTENDTSITISYIEDGMIRTTTQEIIVTNREQIVNYTMIYDAGDECEEITGGLTHEGYITTSNTPCRPATKNADSFFIYYETGYLSYMLGTKNAIDITSYSTFGAVAMCTNTTASTQYGIKAILRGEKNVNSNIMFGSVKCTSSEKNVKTLKTYNISGNTGSAVYVMFVPDQTAGYQGYFYNAFFTKADDWATLAQKAGITASSIGDILTNSTTLLSNAEAVEFMIYNCTGDFMVSAVANSTFLTALNNSSYKTVIQANEHWNKFLNMVA